MRWNIAVLSLSFLVELLIPLQSCTRITVQSDYDHSIDFSKYNSFGWVPHQESEEKSHRGSKKGEVDRQYKDLMNKRLESNVEKILIARGLAKTSEESADLLLSYQFGLKQKMDRIGFRSGGGRGGGISRSMRIPVTEDNIVLEMMDRKTNQLVWRGWAQGELENIAKEPEIIKDSVEKFLGDFPPK